MQEVTWVEYGSDFIWVRCGEHLEEAWRLLEAAPRLAADFAADRSLLQQVTRAAAAVLAVEDVDPAAELYYAAAVCSHLAVALNLEAVHVWASTADCEQPRQALEVLLPALQAAAAAEAVPADGQASCQPAADAPTMDRQQLALRQARALGAARRCGNLRCSNLAGPSEAQLRTHKCSGCRTVRFCSAECSKAAWREHKASWLMSCMRPQLHWVKFKTRCTAGWLLRCSQLRLHFNSSC